MVLNKKLEGKKKKKVAMKNSNFLLSSIGKKFLLATSGTIMFLLFLVPHMGGNILFLFGQDIFNSYAYHLHELVPIVIGIEILMLISISIHMFMGIRTAIQNKKAASKRHSLKQTKRKIFGGSFDACIGSNDICIYMYPFS